MTDHSPGGPGESAKSDIPPQTDTMHESQSRPGQVADGPRYLAPLTVLALLWLAGTMWAGYRMVRTEPAGSALAAVQTAIALPTIVMASVLAGTASGLAIGAAAARRTAAAAHPAIARLTTGSAAGLLVALVAAGAVAAAGRTTAGTAAAAVAIGAVLGGAASALRPALAVAGGTAATLATLAVGLTRGVFTARLAGLFGAGGTVASQLTADARTELAASLVSGLAAGLAGYWYLRRSRAAPRWPEYLLAGGAPGVLLLVAELVVRLVGWQLLASVARTSEIDRAAVAYLNEVRLNHAMIVFFVGGLTAILTLGFTMAPKRTKPDSEPLR